MKRLLFIFTAILLVSCEKEILEQDEETPDYYYLQTTLCKVQSTILSDTLLEHGYGKLKGKPLKGASIYINGIKVTETDELGKCEFQLARGEHIMKVSFNQCPYGVFPPMEDMLIKVKVVNVSIGDGSSDNPWRARSDFYVYNENTFQYELKTSCDGGWICNPYDFFVYMKE